MPGNSPFKQIDKVFLNRSEDQNFSVFVREYSGNTEHFVKFADRSRSHQEKLRRLLDNHQLTQSLYIHQKDWDSYLKQMSAHLIQLIDKGKVSTKIISKKLFSASREIMKGFFNDSQVSQPMGKTADQVVETLLACFSQTDLKFGSLAKILATDMQAYTHSLNVAIYCIAYGSHIKLPPGDLYALGVGAIFHDLGLLKIPQKTLHKQGLHHDIGNLPVVEPGNTDLTPQEVEMLKNHPIQGRRMLEALHRYDDPILNMVEQHHENFRAGGYPVNLSGDNISFFARICKVADTFDTLQNPRPYRAKHYTSFQALQFMVDKIKNQFDPEILKVFIKIMGPAV